jgi:transposase
VITHQQLDSLDLQQTRQALLTLMAEMALKDELLARERSEVAFKQALIDKLTHELAILRRLKYTVTSEKFCAGMSAEQKSLLEETLDSDIAQLTAELEQAADDKPHDKDKKAKETPKREPLPPHLPRRDVHHEPQNTACACGCQMKRIGQDVAERLDYEPGVFSVERHVRGKWACGACQKLVQAPVPAHVIDKGIPTAGLLAHVLVAKFLDHLPLYRQERIFERAGMLIARSTLAQWVGECGAQLQPLVDALTAQMLRHGVLHADETPVSMLKPGNKKTHKAYIWTYCTTRFNETQAVVFNFAETRSGENVRGFLRQDSDHAWKGTLVTDGFSGYKATFERGVTEAGCVAHARRKFHELWANHGSKVGEQALKYFQVLFRTTCSCERSDAGACAMAGQAFTTCRSKMPSASRALMQPLLRCSFTYSSSNAASECLARSAAAAAAAISASRRSSLACAKRSRSLSFAPRSPPLSRCCSCRMASSRQRSRAAARLNPRGVGSIFFGGADGS